MPSGGGGGGQDRIRGGRGGGSLGETGGAGGERGGGSDKCQTAYRGAGLASPKTAVLSKLKVGDVLDLQPQAQGNYYVLVAADRIRKRQDEICENSGMVMIYPQVPRHVLATIITEEMNRADLALPVAGSKLSRVAEARQRIANGKRVFRPDIVGDLCDEIDRLRAATPPAPPSEAVTDTRLQESIAAALTANRTTLDRAALAKAWDMAFEGTIVPRSDWPTDPDALKERGLQDFPAYFELFIAALEELRPVADSSSAVETIEAKRDEWQRLSRIAEGELRTQLDLHVIAANEILKAIKG